MIFGADREFLPLYGLTWKRHRRVHFRFDDTHPLAGSHHQKIVVVDDKVAFVGGLDLTSRRWDSPEHRPDDPRRVALGKPYPPFHDLMIAVDGEAARAAAEIARKRWRAATGEALHPVATAGDPWPESLAPAMTDVDVALACTEPAVNGTPGEPHGRAALPRSHRARGALHLPREPVLHLAVDRARARGAACGGRRPGDRARHPPPQPRLAGGDDDARPAHQG